MDTKKVGDITEAVLTMALLKAGKQILTPFGEGQPYDLVFVENGAFKTVQCKTARLKKSGSIYFNLYSVVRDAITKKYIKHYYNKEVNYYGVYSPDLNRAFLVPSDILPKCEGVLRISESSRYKGLIASKYELKI